VWIVSQGGIRGSGQRHAPFVVKVDFKTRKAKFRVIYVQLGNGHRRVQQDARFAQVEPLAQACTSALQVLAPTARLGVTLQRLVVWSSVYSAIKGDILHLEAALHASRVAKAGTVQLWAPPMCLSAMSVRQGSTRH
jgi:hypothetical protein